MTPQVDWFALAPALVAPRRGRGGAARRGARPARRARGPSARSRGRRASWSRSSFAALLFDDADESRLVVADAFARDRFAALAAMIVCGAALLAVGVS